MKSLVLNAKLRALEARKSAAAFDRVMRSPRVPVPVRLFACVVADIDTNLAKLGDDHAKAISP